MRIKIDEPYRGHFYAIDDDTYDAEIVDGAYVGGATGLGGNLIRGCP